MTKCKRCGKEFEGSTVERSEPYDRGDGVMYCGISYVGHPVCPYCGFDNSLKTFMRGGNKL